MAWDGNERRVYPASCYVEVLARITGIEAQNKTMIERMDRMVNFIEGNGGVGAKVRLDRVEQKMGLVWGLLVAVGGLTLKAVFDVVAK